MLGKRRRQVRVHVQDGPTIEGVLAARTRHAYVIWAPKLLRSDAQPTELVGHVEVPRDRVLFFQVLD